jgi:hypothetical protein
VSLDGTRSVLRTFAEMEPVPLAAVTAPIRRAIGTAVSGSLASLPPNVWPGAAVSRLVPSVLSLSRNACALDAGMPITATSAAMPIAMPSADSTARIGRVRIPKKPRRSRSITRSPRREPRCAAAPVLRRRGRA